MGGVRCLGLFPKKNRFFFWKASLNQKVKPICANMDALCVPRKLGFTKAAQDTRDLISVGGNSSLKMQWSVGEVGEKLCR